MEARHVLASSCLMCAALVLSQIAHADCPDSAYYVANTGDDSATGGVDDPWRTINHAIDSTGPGDCVYVRGGEYDEGGEIWIRETQGGAAGAWWSLEAFPGEDVRLLTRVLMEGSYIRVKGFQMASGAGIASRNSGEYKEILDNHFQGFYRYAPISAGTRHVLVEGNVIELDGTGETTDHGVYVHYGDDLVIRRNVITGYPGYGVHVYDEDKYDWSPDIQNVVVEQNYLGGSTQRAGIIVATGSGVNIRNVTLRYNVIVDNAGRGIDVRSNRVSDVQIFHNTLVDSGGTGVVIDEAVNVSISNNIIWGSSEAVQSTGTGVVLDTNLYGPGTPTFDGISDPAAIFDDPLFVDPAGHDFHLQAGSPAIDVGLELGLPYEDSAPDLGAYEYGASPDGGVLPPPDSGGASGSGGSGGGGAGASGNAGAGGGALPDGGGTGGGFFGSPEQDDGCGCRSAGTRRSGRPWLVLGAFALAMSRWVKCSLRSGNR